MIFIYKKILNNYFFLFTRASEPTRSTPLLARAGYVLCGTGQRGSAGSISEFVPHFLIMGRGHHYAI